MRELGGVVFCVKIKNPLKKSAGFVGAAGFEPAASWSQTKRDNRTTLRPENKMFPAERLGFEPRQRVSVDGLAIRSINHSGTSPKNSKELMFFSDCKYI